MPSPQQQQGGLKKDLNVFIGLCQIGAYPVEIWLRRPGTCGARYFAGQCYIGLFGLFIIASFTYSTELMQVCMASVAWLVVHKLATAKQKVRVHSRYVGRSIFSFLGGDVPAIRFWEPLATFIAGRVMLDEGIPFSGLVMILAVCMFVSGFYTAAAERATLTSIDDARAEQQWISEYMNK
jgi:hypothetical protein